MPSHTAWLISRILNAVFADRAFCTFKIGYLERIHSLKCSRFAGARCETAKLLSHSNYVPPTNNQYCCFFMSRTHKNPFPVRGSASTPVAYFSWQSAQRVKFNHNAMESVGQQQEISARKQSFSVFQFYWCEYRTEPLSKPISCFSMISKSTARPRSFSNCLLNFN